MLHNIRNAMSPLANQLQRAISATAPAVANIDRALEELRAPDVDADRKTKLVDYLEKCWQKEADDRHRVRDELGAASSQLSTIEQILNQHQGDKHIRTEPLSLQALVRESISLFSSEDFKIAQIDIASSLSEMPSVVAARLPMIHVFYNLIDNAIVAIEARGGAKGGGKPTKQRKISTGASR